MTDQPTPRRQLIDEDDEAEEAAEGEDIEDAGDGEDEGPGEVNISYLVTGRRVWMGASSVVFSACCGSQILKQVPFFRRIFCGTMKHASFPSPPNLMCRNTALHGPPQLGGQPCKGTVGRMQPSSIFLHLQQG